MESSANLNPSPVIRAIDLFCGMGGSSWGAKAAGAEVVAAFDRWSLAGKTHHENFPNTAFFEGRLEDCDAQALVSQIGPIDLIMASPECTNHSPAKGAAARCDVSKNTAFQVITFARAFKPRWVIVENVVNMKNWSRYREFCEALGGEGYHVTEQKLNSADFGVPQSRERLFLLCDRQGKPTEVPRPCLPQLPASSFINLNGQYAWTPVDNGRRAKPTLERARRGREQVKHKPFLIVYYGSDGAGGWQKLSRPLRTVTTVDRFAVVKQQKGVDVMRMLQPEELAIAMGMNGMALSHGSRRDKIHMLGNAVCPPVMKAVVSHLTGAGCAKAASLAKQEGSIKSKCVSRGPAVKAK
ncbi:MAG: DNA cytosine methyltransferase [Verrucomicrobia bacterium]|nr:DNA cytosine methyltransferase [Verrucomicrobiota bacterium]